MDYRIECRRTNPGPGRRWEDYQTYRREISASRRSYITGFLTGILFMVAVIAFLKFIIGIL